MGKKTNTIKKLDNNSTSGKKQTNPNSLANLIPGANKKGRPVGKLNFDTRIEMAIDVLANKYVEDMNSKNKKVKGYKPITLEDVDIEGDIFAQYLNKARNGSEKMLIDFIDRRHGKATQRLELTGKDGSPIEYQERMAKADAETDEWVRGWVKVPKKEDDNTTNTTTKG